MPKVSAASLSVVALARDFEPAPVTLSKAAAEVWRKVIRTKPLDWFGHETFPLLETYCSLIVEHRLVLGAAQSLDAVALASDGLVRYERLNRLLDGQRRTLSLLATKMRLAQQSKYGARQATEGKNRPAPAGSMPWDAQ